MACWSLQSHLLSGDTFSKGFISSWRYVPSLRPCNYPFIAGHPRSRDCAIKCNRRSQLCKKKKKKNPTPNKPILKITTGPASWLDVIFFLFTVVLSLVFVLPSKSVPLTGRLTESTFLTLFCFPSIVLEGLFLRGEWVAVSTLGNRLWRI